MQRFKSFIEENKNFDIQKYIKLKKLKNFARVENNDSMFQSVYGHLDKERRQE